MCCKTGVTPWSWPAGGITYLIWLETPWIPQQQLEITAGKNIDAAAEPTAKWTTSFCSLGERKESDEGFEEISCIYKSNNLTNLQQQIYRKPTTCTMTFYSKPVMDDQHKYTPYIKCEFIYEQPPSGRLTISKQMIVWLQLQKQASCCIWQKRI